MHPAFYIPLLVYVVFILFIWRGLRLKDKHSKSKKSQFISVIVACRNEEDNLPNLLESLKKLKYPKSKFEIIFIDDNSTDGTPELLNEYSDDKNIFAFKAEGKNGERAFKKNAIETGINHARGEIIVTTDADCIVPENWLTQIAENFEETTGFVAGPVKITYGKSIFSRLQSLEFAGLMLSAAGMIKAGYPVTCSGANIAYRKKAFLEVNGFEGIDNLSSGDDELLMQKIHASGKYGIKYLWQLEAVVLTTATNKMQQFFQQRKRWASKSLFYKKPVLILILILVYLFFLSIPLSLVMAYFNPIYFEYFVTAAGSKILVDFLVMQAGKNFFYDGGLLRYFGLAEFLHAPYIIFSAFAGLFGNFTWKERKLER